MTRHSRHRLAIFAAAIGAFALLISTAGCSAKQDAPIVTVMFGINESFRLNEAGKAIGDKTTITRSLGTAQSNYFTRIQLNGPAKFVGYDLEVRTGGKKVSSATGTKFEPHSDQKTRSISWIDWDAYKTTYQVWVVPLTGRPINTGIQVVIHGSAYKTPK